jgi:hypothetical protein
MTLIAIVVVIGLLIAVIPIVLLILSRLRTKKRFKLPDLLEDSHTPHCHPDGQESESYRPMGLTPIPSELIPTPFILPAETKFAPKGM